MMRDFFNTYVRDVFPARRAAAGASWAWPGDEWADDRLREATWRWIVERSCDPASEDGVAPREVIEIGPGAGKHTAMLLERTQARVTTYEISDAFIACLEERCARFVADGRLRSLRIDWTDNEGLLRSRERTGDVDLVLAIDVLMMMDFQSALVYLVTAAALLRPGGRLFATFADAGSESGFARMMRDLGRHSATDPAPCTRFHWINRSLLETVLPRLGSATWTSGTDPRAAWTSRGSTSRRNSLIQSSVTMLPFTSRRPAATPRTSLAFSPSACEERMDAKSPRDTIPFYRPVVGASASQCIADALLGPISGGGRFTAECHRLMREAIPAGVPFLTSSCTDALELAALALDLKPGDEVVMPSWTFPSTANAFALRGAVPVFVDVMSGTLAINPEAAAAAITARTRALVCVHYAGVACDMARLVPLCEHHGIALIEDAAQAYHAFWNDVPLGGLGDFGTFSFHGTKNVSCGEGGALIVRRNDLLPRVEIAWEKGTDRLRFQEGQVDVYQWQDLGSSFLPSEVTAAFLSAQLAAAASVTESRRLAWERYAALMAGGGLPNLIGPVVPAYARHNGHIFAVQLEDPRRRRDVLVHLDAYGIDARPHYHPLHTSPAGRRLGRASGPLAVTEAAGAGLIRLPLDSSITRAEQERVISALDDAVRHACTH